MYRSSPRKNKFLNSIKEGLHKLWQNVEIVRKKEAKEKKIGRNNFFDFRKNQFDLSKMTQNDGKEESDEKGARWSS